MSAQNSSFTFDHKPNVPLPDDGVPCPASLDIEDDDFSWMDDEDEDAAPAAPLLLDCEDVDDDAFDDIGCEDLGDDA